MTPAAPTTRRTALTAKSVAGLEVVNGLRNVPRFVIPGLLRICPANASCSPASENPQNAPVEPGSASSRDVEDERRDEPDRSGDRPRDEDVVASRPGHHGGELPVEDYNDEGGEGPDPEREVVVHVLVVVGSDPEEPGPAREPGKEDDAPDEDVYPGELFDEPRRLAHEPRLSGASFWQRRGNSPPRYLKLVTGFGSPSGTGVTGLERLNRPTRPAGPMSHPRPGDPEAPRLGYWSAQEQYPMSDLLDFAVEAERGGFQSMMASDHFHPWFHTGGFGNFTWIWMAAAAERTKRMSFYTGVTCPIFRYTPGVVAQAFASLDDLSSGRVGLGVGTGEAMNEVPNGFEWGTQSERLERTKEAIEIIKALWEGGDRFLDYRGRYYRRSGRASTPRRRATSRSTWPRSGRTRRGPRTMLRWADHLPQGRRARAAVHGLSGRGEGGGKGPRVARNCRGVQGLLRPRLRQGVRLGQALEAHTAPRRPDVGDTRPEELSRRQSGRSPTRASRSPGRWSPRSSRPRTRSNGTSRRGSPRSMSTARAPTSSSSSVPSRRGSCRTSAPGAEGIIGARGARGAAGPSDDLKVSAVLLAAGLSTRFGRTKQLADLDGTALVRRSYSTLQRTLVREVVVVVGHDASRVARELRGYERDGGGQRGIPVGDRLVTQRRGLGAGHGERGGRGLPRGPAVRHRRVDRPDHQPASPDGRRRGGHGLAGAREPPGALRQGPLRGAR